MERSGEKEVKIEKIGQDLQIYGRDLQLYGQQRYLISDSWVLKDPCTKIGRKSAIKTRNQW